MTQTCELKQSNIDLVRACFYDGNIWTKNALSHHTGLSLAGTTNVLQELLRRNEISYVGDSESTGGRKSKNYILNKDYAHIGLLVLKKQKDKDVMMCRRSDLFSNIIWEKTLTCKDGSINEIEKLLKELMEDSKISVLVISIPGICIGGHIDVCDYHLLEGMDLKAYLEEKYHIEVIIENDVNVACIGLSDDYPDTKHLAFMYQPAVEYVGCGMMIDGKLHNGFSHFAGELRYLPFYTHKQQDDLLKTNPKLLLTNQILTLVSVMNPEIVGYCSDVFNEELKLEADFASCHLPKLVKVHDFDEMLVKGIMKIAIKFMKEGKYKNGKIY